MLSARKDPAPSLIRPKCGSANHSPTVILSSLSLCWLTRNPLSPLVFESSIHGFDITLSETILGMTIASDGVNCISPLIPSIGQQSNPSETNSTRLSAPPRRLLPSSLDRDWSRGASACVFVRLSGGLWWDQINHQSRIRPGPARPTLKLTPSKHSPMPGFGVIAFLLQLGLSAICFEAVGRGCALRR